MIVEFGTFDYLVSMRRYVGIDGLFMGSLLSFFVVNIITYSNLRLFSQRWKWILFETDGMSTNRNRGRLDCFAWNKKVWTVAKMVYTETKKGTTSQ